MKPALLISLLGAVAGCATPSDSTQPVRAVCRQTDCFYERQVRDFEFFGSSTMVAYVGPSRCAYRMELRGSYCELAIASPYIDFEDNGDGRVCIYDSPYLGSGPFSETRDVMDRCRVVSITPLTDDELLEMYVNAGARPPLPPIGSGELSVEENGDEDGRQTAGQGSEAAAEEGADEQAEGEAAGSAGTPAAAL